MIRLARPEDVALLADLLRSLEELPNLQALSAPQVAAQVRGPLSACLNDPGHSVYVAEEAGAILGYIAVHWLPYLIMAGPEGFVSELFVNRTARTRGIGSNLLNQAVQEARKRGCKRLHLVHLRSRESYRSGFYVHRGWQERADAADFILNL